MTGSGCCPHERLANHLGEVRPPDERQDREQDVGPTASPAAAPPGSHGRRPHHAPAAQRPGPGEPPGPELGLTRRAAEAASPKVLLDERGVGAYHEHGVRPCTS